jgi:hypothetical protein
MKNRNAPASKEDTANLMPDESIDLDNAEVRRERLIHIDQMLADHDRRRQEVMLAPRQLAPWQLALVGMAAGAGFMAAGAAIFALLFKLLK